MTVHLLKEGNTDVWDVTGFGLIAGSGQSGDEEDLAASAGQNPITTADLAPGTYTAGTVDRDRRQRAAQTGLQRGHLLPVPGSSRS